MDVQMDELGRHAGFLLARILHDRFCCNRGYAAATGGLAVQSFNVLFQVRLSPSRLHAPVSLGVCTISRRTVMNNQGLSGVFVERRIILATVSCRVNR
jgi:energy-converting hydrogenase Eha subunit B